MSDKLIDVCPGQPGEECGCSQLDVRRGGLTRDVPDSGRYRCRRCGHEFDDPDRRERQEGPPRPDTLASQLEEMEPDAIGGGADA